MPVPFLPVDVVVTILENLRGDTATLRACGMACHDWLGAARPSLFRSLYFTANLTQRGITSAQDVSASSSALLGKLRDFAAFLDKNLDKWSNLSPLDCLGGRDELRVVVA